jgi:hypothetical protein
LERIVSLAPGQRADARDLVDYALDITYEEVQGDLLRYALPICLQAWRQDLLGHDKAYGGFVEHFYPELWTAWWSSGSVGRAIAIVQYASCLLYGATDSPVFTAWTRIGGGGPPALWEFAGHLYTHRWQEPNVSFLREALTPQAVLEVLRRAAVQLDGQPEHTLAAQVVKDATAREAISRCAELPRILERTQDPGDRIEWAL